MLLYVAYLFFVRKDITFTHLQTVPTVLIVGLAFTAFFIVVYLLWYLISVILTILYFKQIPFRSRIMFFYNLIMLIICCCTVIFGVFSPFYANGGLFTFFYCLFNIYCWSLVYLNWPISYAKRESTNEGEVIELELRTQRGED